jgi:asparagine synthase (glutamine-hydrolysing)
MSRIAACLGFPQGGRAGHLVQALLKLSGEDAARRDVWQAEDAAVGVSRAEWQCDPSLEGTTLLARTANVVVAADASIYAVEGESGWTDSAGNAPGLDAATLILHAYGRWGDDCARHLNGDFAFVVWDAVRRRALLCRDIVGRRALFVRATDAACTVSSGASGLARLVEPAAPVNLVLVAAAASALPGGSNESGYEGVSPVPAGATLAWSAASGLRELARWQPPPFRIHSPQPFDEAARELRAILTSAVERRIAPGRTAVWLSGGADSTAIYACAKAAGESGSPAGAIVPISVSYPEGDLAREDEFILALARRWGATVSWVDSESIPLFSGIEERARLRDDPLAHTFAPVNSALAARSSAVGAHVALDGFGGDALFEVSNAYLADLLLAGDLRGWLHARRASGTTSFRSTVRWGILPALPAWCWRAADAVRRKPLSRPYRYPIVRWLSARFRAALLERRWDHIDLQRVRGEGPATFEARVGLTGPHYSRMLALTRAQTTPAAVEVRSPLMDPRVIEFAATRPVAERGWQGNNKRLLKAAMSGIIPDSVLAPRAAKTGVASGYLHRQFRAGLHGRLQAAFGRSSALGDAGLIDPAVLLDAAAGYEARPDHLTGVTLCHTLEAEYWLRAR